MLDFRVWKGISVASFIATTLAALSMVIFSSFGEADLAARLGAIFFTVLLTFVIGFPIAFLGCLFIGLPVHLMLQKIGWTSPWVYLLAATAASTTFALWAGTSKALMSLDWANVRDIDLLMASQIALGGPIVALTFLWVTRRR